MFRAWGRVGTTIGGTKVEPFMSKAGAVHAFCQLYGEKTGNDWDDRANFTKVTVLYALLLSYALGAIAGQPGNGIIVCRV